MLNNYQFPDEFMWGAAASAPQTEGAANTHGKSPSTWDKWFEMNPELFNQNIGPQITSDVYNLYKEDVQRMEDMNLNSYRTSISWTRLLPDGKTLNKEAVDFYRDYFETLKDHGVEPIVNLFHFDMPWWLMKQGGWENIEITDHFEHYAKVCAQEFGDLVSTWTTFNEPIVHVEMSYLYGHHYPAVEDFKTAVKAGYNTVLAHAKAIRSMKAVNKELDIGTILNLTPVYSRSDSKEDLEATRLAKLLKISSFIDAMVVGEFSNDLINTLKEHELLPDTSLKDLEIIKENTAEFLGVNFYQPIRVKAPEGNVNFPAKNLEDLFEPYVWPDRKMNPYRGWEIYPEALMDIAMMIMDEYDNIPWYLSENGMGVADEERFENEDGIIQDDYRIDFIGDHLAVLGQAIDKGANIFGYHLWTFVDNWSWLNGYRNRYGYYRVDIETQERTPKKSSFWMRDLIEKQTGGK